MKGRAYATGWYTLSKYCPQVAAAVRLTETLHIIFVADDMAARYGFLIDTHTQASVIKKKERERKSEMRNI